MALEPLDGLSERRARETRHYLRSPEAIENPQERVDLPIFVGVPPIPALGELGPEKRVFFPNGRQSLHGMEPLPVPVNLQLYPFSLHVPTEGGSLLSYKEMEAFLTHVYSKGSLHDSNSVFRLDMHQWFLEQDFGIRMGLPWRANISLSAPLYHFNGPASFTMNGVEMIGLGNDTRNFWGGTILSVKKLLLEAREGRRRFLLSTWLQLPEGNQRARGGTTSGHYALNAILEERLHSYRVGFNAGVVEAGELRMLNDVKLRQTREFFAAGILRREITSVISLEMQLHTRRSALEYTGLHDLREWQSWMALGVRGNKAPLEFSLATLAGADSFPKLGFAGDVSFKF